MSTGKEPFSETPKLVKNTNISYVDEGFGVHTTLESAFPSPTGPRTLESASRYVLEELGREGKSQCPCCGKDISIKFARLNEALSRALILLYARHQNNPTPVKLGAFFRSLKGVSASLVSGGDVAKLRYWRFLRKVDGKLYQFMDEGKVFVEDRSAVPSHVGIFDSKVIGWSNIQINIKDSLGVDDEMYKQILADAKTAVRMAF